MISPVFEFVTRGTLLGRSLPWSTLHLRKCFGVHLFQILAHLAELPLRARNPQWVRYDTPRAATGMRVHSIRFHSEPGIKPLEVLLIGARERLGRVHQPQQVVVASHQLHFGLRR